MRVGPLATAPSAIVIYILLLDLRCKRRHFCRSCNQKRAAISPVTIGSDVLKA